MRNIELRHTFPHLLSGRCLKTLVPGVVLALLATPVLAEEQRQGNVLTLGGGVDVGRATRVQIKPASQRLR
jgi:hypothetical protein